MVVDFNIFNSILFDTLRPWLPVNQSDEKFRQFVKLLSKANFTNFDSFVKSVNSNYKINSAISFDEEYRIEIDIDTNFENTTSIDIFEPLIQIDFEPAYNYKTEYYHNLIINEGTKLIGSISNGLRFYEHETDKKFLVNSSLDRIKFYLRQTAQKIKDLANNPIKPEDDPKQEAKTTDYILNTLKLTLIRTYLEIQELFPTLLNDNPISEDDIYNKIMDLKAPLHGAVKNSSNLDTVKIKKLIDENCIDIDTINKIFEQVRNNNTNSELDSKQILNFRILENYIFLITFNSYNSDISYSDLYNFDFESQVYEKFTSFIFDNLEDISHPTKRIDYISKELLKFSRFEKLNYTNADKLNVTIPRRIIVWLNSQSKFYEANLHIDPTKLNLSPKTKIKTTLNTSELAYLFRLLDDVDCFDMSDKKAICKAISETFTTKQMRKDELGVDSLYNKFYTKDEKAIEKLHPIFKKMQQIAFDDKKFLDSK